MRGQNIPDSIRGTTRLSTMSSGYAKMAWPAGDQTASSRYGEDAGIIA